MKANTITLVPCIRTITNTPQTPRKTELKGAIPRTWCSSIGHHSARFYGAKERGNTIRSRSSLQSIEYMYKCRARIVPPTWSRLIPSLVTLENRSPLEAKATNFPSEKEGFLSSKNDKKTRRARFAIDPTRDVFGLLISRRHATDSTRSPAQP